MSSETKTSAVTNSPRKKKPSPAIEPALISSLPYDLLLNCIARISRLYYPTLSLVSKQFRSIVASSELYETRSLLNRTECCLYFCLQHPNTCWFTLCRTPKRGYRLVPVPSPHFPTRESKNLVAVGSNIYKIGGDWVSSSIVSVLDCKTHKWHQAPSMSVNRNCSSTGISLDGKVYVAGGCEDLSSSNWVEVFDPKAQSWGSVTNPGFEKRNGGKVISFGLNGRFYLFRNKKFVVYNPEEDRWNKIGVDAKMASAVCYSYGVIGDVLIYWKEDKEFKWFDFKVKKWKTVNGLKLERVSKLCHRGHCLMVDVGGKMMVLWDELKCYTRQPSEKVIFCAQIALERREDDGDEIWGKVEWFNAVLPVNKSCRVLYSDGLSATV